MNRLYSGTVARLRQAEIQPTRQRVGLSFLLFGEEFRHVTADQLRQEAAKSGLSVSLATVYNTLHQLCLARLLSEVVVEQGRSYFDTNAAKHHHFFNVDTGELTDFSASDFDLSIMPQPPKGTSIEQVSIVIRVRSAQPESELSPPLN
jgi:Fur family iron response transcriptional regulator